MYFYEFFIVVIYVHSHVLCDAVDRIIIEREWIYLKGKVLQASCSTETSSLRFLVSQACRTKAVALWDPN